MSSIKVILSGGGTGGHIFPAVAIANAIKKIQPDAEILFVGALGRMEMEKVPAAGYKIIGVPIAGLQRKFSLANLKLPFLIIKSLLATRKIINDFKPDVAVGTGGYASAPLLRAAGAKGVPYLLQEQNSFAGITNKILSKNASKICVAYQGMEKFFPANKLLLTGNPVRQELSRPGDLRNEGIAYFKLNAAKKTILIIGGSLGARTINDAVLKNAGLFANANVQVLWQTGKMYYPKISEQIKQDKPDSVFAHEFIARMDLAYACADIVISRAGASSVSEICNLGKAAILVPSPNVAEDHQTKNAQALVNKNAAVLVTDAEAAAKLVSTALEVIADQNLLEQLQSNAKQMAYPDAATVIAKEVLKLVSKK